MRTIRMLKIGAIAAALAASLVGIATTGAAAATTVSLVTVSASPYTAGTGGATYTFEFKSSPTGALTAGVGTITLSGLTGTFPSSAGSYTIDAAAHHGTATGISFSGPSVTLTTPVAVANSTLASVTVVGVTNPSAGNYSASINTSSDATPQSATYSIGTATQLVTSGGNLQSAPVGNPFAIHLGASLKDAANAPFYEGGVPVTFTVVPGGGGAGATFANTTSTTSVVTGPTGVATSSLLTANGVVGAFTVTATSPGLTTATFTLTNVAVGTPGAPTGVSAAAGNQSATVSWTAPVSTGGSPITGYTVTSSPGGITATTVAPATSVVVSGLTNGTAYTFIVTAANGVGSGASSAPSNSVTPVAPPPVTSPANHGYWLVGGDGGIFTFGSAQFYGSTGNIKLSRPVVGIVPTQSRHGYWLDASDGGVFAFGDAPFAGSIPALGILPAGYPGGGRDLAAPIVGMVPSATGGGYFMVGADGGVFAFGDAHFAGSCPSIGGCSGAAVAVMPDASGNGYWLVTASGHVYAFGDAPYLGAPGSVGSPVTSAVRTADGNGYWILLADGTVYNYGDAANLGAPLGIASGLNPATAIFATATGGGYWVALADGSVYNYGDAPYDGGRSGSHLNAPIIAATGW